MVPFPRTKPLVAYDSQKIEAVGTFLREQSKDAALLDFQYPLAFEYLLSLVESQRVTIGKCREYLEEQSSSEKRQRLLAFIDIVQPRSALENAAQALQEAGY